MKLARLKKCIELSRRFRSRREPTIFAVGGRGYYENPASDLLAFFLNPTSGHGLGPLFLCALLQCLEFGDLAEEALLSVSVSREIRTKTGGRIDIQILGGDWCLLIENKIRHDANNPFKSYEEHALSLRDRAIFCMLSPDGSSPLPEKWKGISYQKYCSLLEEKLENLNKRPYRGKWGVLASELVGHIQNELYLPAMNNEELEFAEKFAGEIKTLENLKARYLAFVCSEIKKRLEEALPKSMFTVIPEKWEMTDTTFRCTSKQWGETDMVICRSDDSNCGYFIRLYLDDDSEPRLERAKAMFLHMTSDKEGEYPFWTSVDPYRSREEAIEKLCELAKLVDKLISK